MHQASRKQLKIEKTAKQGKQLSHHKIHLILLNMDPKKGSNCKKLSEIIKTEQDQA